MNKTSISTDDKKRYIREYQAKRRGSRSYKTESEDASVIVAYAMGEITEGTAAKALNVDRVKLRERTWDLVNVGCARAGVPVPSDESQKAFDAILGGAVEIVSGK